MSFFHQVFGYLDHFTLGHPTLFLGEKNGNQKIRSRKRLHVKEKSTDKKKQIHTPPKKIKIKEN